MKTKMNDSRIVFGAAWLALGCGDPSQQGDPEIGADVAPITGGTLVPYHFGASASAVRLRYTDRFGVEHFCSGIKVSSTAFWTAGHCADDYGVGDSISITNRLDGAFSGSGSYTRTISAVAAHPSLWNAYNMLPFGGSPAYYDVARFTVSASTPDIPSYSTTDAAWVGPDQTVRMVGYGCDVEDASHSGRKQFADFVLEDHDEAAAIGQGLAAYVHDMIDVGDSPQGCDGDSGGPVTQSVSGTQKLVGIAVRGGRGYTALSRYSNVRNWLASPAFNQFESGFQGFIFNHTTGRCISRGLPSHREGNCDGRDQNFDFQSWRLADSGSAGSFYLVNGSSGKCLDLATTALGSQLVDRTCLPTSQSNNTQRWRFDATNDADYRRLVNTTTGHCIAPSAPSSSSSVLVSQTCSSSSPTWRHQAWMMTR
ncbi:MAG TPA: RICIN domain-containing protein [Polyangiaceae bacterium]